MGLNFCIKSLDKSLLNLKVNPRYLISVLNSKFMDILKPTCLIKALVFKNLAKDSSNFFLCIGVTRTDGNFASHAWIEMDGEIILNYIDNINCFKKILVHE